MKSALRLIGVGLAVFLVVELGLRVFAPAAWWTTFHTAGAEGSERWQSHPFLTFVGRASETLEFDHGDVVERVTHNSYGFRAHEFPESKAAEDFVVLCLGGGTTYGFRVPSNDQTWPELLEAKLRAQYPDRNVRVYNLGLDEATTTASVVALGLVGVHVKPDLVLAYHGDDDLAALGLADHRTDHAHVFRDRDLRTPRRGFQSFVPFWARGSLALRVATGALDRSIFVNDSSDAEEPASTPHADPLHGITTVFKNHRTIRAMAKGRGGEAIFSTFRFGASGDPRGAAFNQALRANFADTGSLWVDQDALLPKSGVTRDEPRLHFTAKGRELLADNFFDFIVAKGLLDGAG